MCTVTEFFGVSKPPHFLDVGLLQDNPFYIDPLRIRICGRRDYYALIASSCLDSHAREVARGAGQGGSERERKLELLRRFPEPWETRLGCAKSSYRGRGGSIGFGRKILGLLSDDCFALASDSFWGVENYQLFVPGVAEDRTSDMTTRIVYLALAQYTAAAVYHHTELSASVQCFHRLVWSPCEARWVKRDVMMPTVHGDPLLLVPRTWVSGRLVMSARDYYKTVVMPYMKNSGESRPVSRAQSLNSYGESARSAPFKVMNRKVTGKAFMKGVDLAARYRSLKCAAMGQTLCP